MTVYIYTDFGPCKLICAADRSSCSVTACLGLSTQFTGHLGAQLSEYVNMVKPIYQYIQFNSSYYTGVLDSHHPSA